MLDVLSSAVIVAVLILAGSVLVFQFVTGVPPMPSTAGEIANVIALLRQAGIAPHAVIYELGSGWGSLVVALAKAFPQAQIRGVELSPLPYWVARFRTRALPNVTLQRRDFHQCDLRDAQAVTCYLMIKSMPKLAALLDDMLRPGTPVVSIAFRFRDRQVAALRAGTGMPGPVVLYFWQISPSTINH